MAVNRRLFWLLPCIEGADDLGPVKIAEDGVDAFIGPEYGNTDMGMFCIPQLVQQRGRNGMVIFPSLFDNGTDLISIQHILPSGGG